MDDEIIKGWVELLDSLSSDEAPAFLSKLRQVHVKARQKVFRQGECDDRLLFIDSGNFRLSYWNSLKKKSEVFAHLSRGDICGAETFFSHSPHTTSLTTTEDSIVRCLYKKDYIHLISEHPALENKLMHYCEKQQKKIVFQDPQELGRRTHHRHATLLKGRVQKIDPDETALHPTLPVTISDISVGGLGCSVEKLGIVEAENFYKSQVLITITYHKNSQPIEIPKKAKVVSVHFFQSGTSKIHLQFHEPISEKIIFEMVQFDSI